MDCSEVKRKLSKRTLSNTSFSSCGRKKRLQKLILSLNRKWSPFFALNLFSQTILILGYTLPSVGFQDILDLTPMRLQSIFDLSPNRIRTVWEKRFSGFQEIFDLFLSRFAFWTKNAHSQIRFFLRPTAEKNVFKILSLKQFFSHFFH